MSKRLVTVKVCALGETRSGYAVFLGDGEKAFLMLIDQDVGTAIALALQGTAPVRPLTHDLVLTVLRAFGARVERVILDDLKDDTYFARLVLSAENELQQKTRFELDVRPSDGIALAVRQGAPICVRGELWDRVEDVSEALRKLQEQGPQAEGGDEDEAP